MANALNIIIAIAQSAHRLNAPDQSVLLRDQR
jgi:hypothetical protein